MRYLLAIVAFVIAAPLLFIAVFVARIAFDDLSAPASDVTFEIVWPSLAKLAGIALLGCVFLVAGIAALVTKPRREQ